MTFDDPMCYPLIYTFGRKLGRGGAQIVYLLSKRTCNYRNNSCAPQRFYDHKWTIRAFRTKLNKECITDVSLLESSKE